MSAYLQLQRWWTGTGASIATEAVPEQRIADLEVRYNLALPDDFRQYLRLSSPVGEVMDDRMGTWWEFNRIKNIADEYPHELDPTIAAHASKYLFFADHCLWCWAWAISCAHDESRGKVVLIGGRGYDKVVASSFSDFVQKYVSDWASVSYR
jgi:hypothetical protein